MRRQGLGPAAAEVSMTSIVDGLVLPLIPCAVLGKLLGVLTLAVSEDEPEEEGHDREGHQEDEREGEHSPKGYVEPVAGDREGGEDEVVGDAEDGEPCWVGEAQDGGSPVEEDCWRMPQETPTTTRLTHQSIPWLIPKSAAATMAAARSTAQENADPLMMPASTTFDIFENSGPLNSDSSSPTSTMSVAPFAWASRLVVSSFSVFSFMMAP